MMWLPSTCLHPDFKHGGGGAHCKNMEHPSPGRSDGAQAAKIAQVLSCTAAAELRQRPPRSTASCLGIARRPPPQLAVRSYEHPHHVQPRTRWLSHLAPISRRPVRTESPWTRVPGNIRAKLSQPARRRRLAVDNLSYSFALVKKPSGLAWVCVDI